MEAYSFRAGSTPLLVSMPHAGTYLPETIRARLTPAALRVPDTDWHLDQLYDFLDALGASVLVGTHSRYVVDLNRPRDDASLYPGQDTTGLIPIDTFAREPLYADGLDPTAAEIAARVERYWTPYHARLAGELSRLCDRFGYALLWDAHSIASVVPRFFPGRLPDLNFGTAGGASCAPAIGVDLVATAQAAAGYTSVLDGRFKGGYITRAYGNPAAGIHAVQLELSQVTYMDEAYPFAFRADRAAGVRPVLRRLVERFVELGASLRVRPP
jgi:N-formylglutamate deformylase